MLLLTTLTSGIVSSINTVWLWLQSYPTKQEASTLWGVIMSIFNGVIIIMSKLKIAVLVIVIILGLGTIAKQYNTVNHQEMALRECGSKANIKHVDSKAFECISVE